MRVFILHLLISLITASILSVPEIFPDISTALSQATSGDTIALAAGSYRGSRNCDLLVNKENISLIGTSGARVTTVDCEKTSRCLTILNVKTAVSGISFMNGQAPETSSEENSLLREAESAVARKRFTPRNESHHPRKILDRGRILVGVVEIFLDRETGNLYYERRQSIKKSRFPRKRRRVALRTDKTSIGGCILVIGSASTLLSNLWVSGGRATMGSGIAVVDSSLQIVGSQVFLNGIRTPAAGVSLFGAGLYLLNTTTTIANCTFDSNFLALQPPNIDGAIYGGGVYVTASTAITFAGRVEFKNNSLSSSSPLNSRGGGLYLEYVAQIFFTGSVLVTANSVFSPLVYFNVVGGGIDMISCDSASNVGEIIASENTVQTSDGYGNSGGGGIFLQSVLSFISTGTLIVRNNLLKCGGSGLCGGGGMGLFYVPNLAISGVASFANNSLVSTSTYLTGGGGVMSSYSSGLMLGASFVGNRVVTTFDSIVDSGRYESPEKNTAIHCQARELLSETAGIITDGSLGTYSKSMNCLWNVVIQNPFNRGFGRLQLTMLRLQIGDGNNQICYFGSVSIYDGDSTFAPLIGTYCGHSRNTSICYTGRCPDLNSPIFTSGTELTVRFVSRDLFLMDGFALEWATVMAPRDLVGTDGNMPSSFVDYPTFGQGGALGAIYSGNLIVKDCYFANNSLRHPFVAVGAAISAALSVLLTIKSCVFISNIVSSVAVAGGGAIAGFQGSSITIDSCAFSSNQAVTNGQCLRLFGTTANCPASIGGAVVDSGAAIFVTNSSFRLNSASCNNQYGTGCRVLGGCISSCQQRSSFVRIMNSGFSRNRVECAANVGCLIGSGGSLFGDAGKVSVWNSSFDENTIVGIGGGGAIGTAGDFYLLIENSRVFNNSATQGGGGYFTETSIVSILSSSVENNVAVLVAGGLATAGSIQLSIYSTLILNNRAGRLSTALAYNDNSKASYLLANSTILSDLGIVILMLGRFLNVGGNVINCTYSGTYYVRDASAQFLSATFVLCTQGTYTFGRASSLLPNGGCKTCPFGARCLGGSGDSDGLRSLAGFWGSVNSTGFATFYPCPNGFCCEDPDGCEYNHCSRGRVGRLCGHCDVGSGLRFFSEGCGNDRECSGVGWAVILPIALSVAFIFTSFLLRTTGQVSSGTFSVLLFFFQVLFLVKSSRWKTVPILVPLLESVANMSPSTSTSSSFGVCMAPGMTQSQRMSIGLLFQALVAGTFVVLFGLQSLFFHVGWGRFRRPEKTHYFISFLRFLSIAFTSLVFTPLQFLRCVELDEPGKLVWFFDASVVCYSGFQVVGFAFIVILIWIPLVCTALMFRWKDPSKLSERKKKVRQVLSNGFTKERRWWLGVSLYRRFLLVVIYTTTSDLIIRSILCGLACLLFLGMNQILRPYANIITHRAETISLFFLTSIAILTIPQNAQQQLGVSLELFGADAIEYTQFFMCLSPIFAYPFVQFAIFRSRRAQNSRPPNPEQIVELQRLPNTADTFILSLFGLDPLSRIEEEWDWA